MATKNIDIIIQAKDLASSSIKNIQASLSGITESVKTASKYVAGLGAGIVVFGLKSAGGLEQTRIAFENLYGSAEQAGKTIQKLTDFSNKTPFEMPEIADMALKLKNVAGITDEDLIPSLTRLGDIASSQGKSLTQSVEAFLDATTGEFERLKEFGITASSQGDKVTFSFRGQTETVKKTNEAIGGYLSRIGEMQGIQGGMEKQSTSLNGLFSTFKDTISGLTRNLVGMSDTGEVIKGGLLDKVKAGLETLTQKINENKEQIKAFGDNVVEVGKNIGDYLLKVGKWILEHKELVKLIGITALGLGTLSVALTAISGVIATLTTIFSAVTIATKGFSIALAFLQKSPILLFISLVVIACYELYKNWGYLVGKAQELSHAIRGLVTELMGGFNNAMKSVLGFLLDVRGGFDHLIDEAKQWGANMIAMFIEGIKSKIYDVKNAVVGIAKTISDNLGFHSPTKEGPGKDSDKWMPNLIKMMAKGLDDGDATIRQASIKIATTLGNAFGKNLGIENIKTTLNNLKGVFLNAFDEMGGAIDSSKSKIQSLKDEIAGLKQSFSDLGTKWGETEKSGKLGLANRALQLQKEIEDIKKTDQMVLMSGTSPELRAKEAELAQAKNYAGAEALKIATTESMKTETQKMIDELSLRLKAIQDERTAVQIKLTEKKQALVDEEVAYKALNDKKIEYENQYYNLFKEHIGIIKTDIQGAIDMMKRLNALSALSSPTSVAGARANGGPVSSGSQYLVGEKGPELFIPRQSGTIIPNNTMGSIININMGGISVNNSADEDRLVEKIKRELTNTLQMSKFGIS